MRYALTLICSHPRQKRAKPCWLRIRIMCPSGAICIPATDLYGFGELAI